MIKNVVFDFGQVMVHFVPSYMVKKHVKDEADAKLLEEVVFDRLYWDKLDAGVISDAEVLSECRKRLPQRLWEAAEKIYESWMDNIPEIEGMPQLVQALKIKGMRVFLLSNISKSFAERANEVSVLKDFEKCIFSAVCGMVKPSADIFSYLCLECEILPEETLFIDDSAKNIDGAQKFGINGYLFDGDVEKLKNYLDEIL